MILFIFSNIIHSEEIEILDNKIIIDEVVFSYINTSEDEKYFEDDELFSFIYNAPSGFFTKNYLDETQITTDIENLYQLYVNNGYFNTKIKLDSLVKYRDEDNQEFSKIYFSIDQNKRTKIGSIKFRNNHFLKDSIVKNIEENNVITLIKNNKFLKSKLDETSDNLLKFYARNGFLETEINSNLVLDSLSNSIEIEFVIDEKDRYRIANISSVNKNINTKSFIINREIIFKKGEIVDYSKLIKTQRSLYDLDIFSSVFVKPRSLRKEIIDLDSISQNHISYIKDRDIIIELKEKKSKKFRVKAGYGTIDKVRTSFEFIHRNLFYTARKLDFKFKWSYINRSASIIISQPWTFGYKISSGLELRYEYEKNPGFRIEEYYSALIFGFKTYQNKTNSILSPFFKKVQPFDITLDPENLGDDIIVESYELIGMRFQFSYDQRNDIFNTTEGYFLSASNELAGSFFGGNVNYTLVELSAKNFLNHNFFIRRKKKNYQTVFASSLNIGFVSAIKDSDIPISELFYSGGPNELRGFNFQSVSPLDSDGIAIGGKVKIAATLLEIRQNFYNSLDFVSFCDVGNVWKDFASINLTDIKINLGVGLRIDTPIFLLRLDYGKNITSGDKTDGGVFQFGIGQVF